MKRKHVGVEYIRHRIYEYGCATGQVDIARIRAAKPTESWKYYYHYSVVIYWCVPANTYNCRTEVWSREVDRGVARSSQEAVEKGTADLLRFLHLPAWMKWSHETICKTVYRYAQEVEALRVLANGPQFRDRLRT